MKVTLHKSTDGQLHDTAKLCASRNIELRTLAAVGTVQDNILMKGFVPAEEYAGTDYVIAAGDIPQFIAANADLLRKTLNEALVAKRPRKAKTAKAAKVAKPTAAAIIADAVAP